MKPNLVLVGFMGTGKTDVGRKVAARLNLTFLDTDDLIEERAGKKISEIFADDGEAHFRRLERDVVQDVARKDSHVIATGGGVVLDPANIQDFQRSGVVICLWAEPDVVFRRTQHAKHRPLMQSGDRRQRIETLLRQREPIYKAIPLRVDNTHTTVDQDVDEVIRIYHQHARA